ncbi:MAG: ABC transporter permease [Desulfobulbus sp.]|nr:ABC transporter permease [Desulfobulbus sp.]
MNLRVVGANLVVSLKCFYRERTAMFFTTMFPILLILVFGAIFMDDDNLHYNLCLQDLDQTETSAEIGKSLASTGKFKVIPVDAAIEATQYVNDTKENLVVVIPKDYEKLSGQYLLNGDLNAFATLRFVYDPSSSSVLEKMQLLNLVFATMNQELSAKPPFIRTAQESIHTRKYRFLKFFIPGIIAMAIMTESLFGTVQVNTELRQRGIIRKLSTTPITRTDWILSSILHQIILAVISTTLMLLVSYIVFDVQLSINAWLPLFIVLDVFTFVGIGMILTRLVREAQSASSAANAIMFPMMFLSGSFFPLEMMPDFLQKFAKVLPLYYLNEGLRAAMVFQDNGTALSNASTIGAVAAVVFILGITVTRWEEGK